MKKNIIKILSSALIIGSLFNISANAAEQVVANSIYSIISNDNLSIGGIHLSDNFQSIKNRFNEYYKYSYNNSNYFSDSTEYGYGNWLLVIDTEGNEIKRIFYSQYGNSGLDLNLGDISIGDTKDKLDSFNKYYYEQTSADVDKIIIDKDFIQLNVYVNNKTKLIYGYEIYYK